MAVLEDRVLALGNVVVVVVELFKLALTPEIAHLVLLETVELEKHIQLPLV
tara:strand:+ start:293 stop:445 length:153 start_codon:yes stop_codon:yes gene_type:complete